MRINKLRKDTEREICWREWIDTRAFRLKSGTRQLSARGAFCLLFCEIKRRSAGEVKPREPKLFYTSRKHGSQRLSKESGLNQIFINKIFPKVCNEIHSALSDI